MKLILKLFSLAFIVVLIGGSVLLFDRYSKNEEKLFPFSYSFKENQKKKTAAPVLIIGDRLGVRLSTFSEIMAKEISKDLVKDIKIESFAKEHKGLHRTLHELKNMEKLPKVILYLGASEEFYENKFLQEDINKIQTNLRFFKDERIQTALVLFPKLSRFIYTPTKDLKLGSSITKDENKYSDMEIMERNALGFSYFQEELTELIDLVQENNSVLILMTTPLNPEIPPRKSCEGTLLLDQKEKLKTINNLAKKNDYKQAYEQSLTLSLLANSNATVHFVHSLVAKNIGKTQEAINSFRFATALDCEEWRGNSVYNSIIRNLSASKDVILFDFEEMLLDEWQKNVIFLDDIYPQNLYFEKASKAIAFKIKSILKI